MSAEIVDGLDAIARDITAGRAVDHGVGQARLVVEREQPALVVVRRAAPDGVLASLVAGQTSRLDASKEENDATLSKAVARMLGALRERFGCALLVELWEADCPDEEHDLCLVEAQEGMFDRTVEHLERSLARDRVEGRCWTVSLAVAEAVAPPERMPLAGPGTPAPADVLGVAVTPRWRGAGAGVAHPGVLRDMRRGLDRALRETIYQYGRARTRIGTPHVHALGSGTLPPFAGEADAALCAVADTYSLLLDVTPVNVPEARAVFHRSGGTTAPPFHYRPLAVDPAGLKRRLYAVDLAPIEDAALYDILDRKRKEIDREITLLDERCGTRFLAGSLAIWGGVDKALSDLADRVLEALPPDGAAAPRKEASIRAAAEAEIARLRGQDPDFDARVVGRADVSGVLVDRGDLVLGTDAATSEDRVEALVQHEVGTHILTRHNGLQQPLPQFGHGMAGYEETQEGIAVLAEYLVGGLTSGRLRLIAARVTAVKALVDGAEFAEIVRLIRDRGLGEGAAFMVAMRVVRGGGLTKDAIYLRGLVRVLDALGHGVDLRDLLVGKIALESWPVVEELRWRGILRPPRLLPRYLEDPAANARLAAVAEGLDILAIAEEIR